MSSFPWFSAFLTKPHFVAVVVALFLPSYFVSNSVYKERLHSRYNSHIQKSIQTQLFKRYNASIVVQCVGDNRRLLKLTYSTAALLTDKPAPLSVHYLSNILLKIRDLAPKYSFEAIPSGIRSGGHCHVHITNSSRRLKFLWKPRLLLTFLQVTKTDILYQDLDAFVYKNYFRTSLIRPRTRKKIIAQADLMTGTVNAGVLWLPYCTEIVDITSKWTRSLGSNSLDDQDELNKIAAKSNLFIILRQGQGADHYVGRTRSKANGKELSSTVHNITSWYNSFVIFLFIALEILTHWKQGGRAPWRFNRSTQRYHPDRVDWLSRSIESLQTGVLVLIHMAAILEIISVALFYSFRNDQICTLPSYMRDSYLIPISGGKRMWYQSRKLMFFDGTCLRKNFITGIGLKNEILVGALYMLSKRVAVSLILCDAFLSRLWSLIPCRPMTLVRDSTTPQGGINRPPSREIILARKDVDDVIQLPRSTPYFSLGPGSNLVS